jgi:Peptidase MA superfamily
MAAPAGLSRIRTMSAIANRPSAIANRRSASALRRAAIRLIAWVAIALLLVGLAAGGLAAKSASAVPDTGITLGAQAQSDHFIVEARHKDVAQGTLTKAERAWARLAPHFERLPQDPVVIVVVEDSKEYERIQPAPMTRGFATFGGRQVYLLGDQLDQEVVTHELVHILMGYNVAPDLRIPDWFNEGLAQYASGARQSGLGLLFWGDATEMLPLSTLDTVDALKGPQRELATVEGLAVVQFLVASYGEPALWELTTRLGHADSFNQALLDTYGRTKLQLNQEWMTYAEDTYSLLSPRGVRILGVLAFAFLVMLTTTVWFVRRTIMLVKSSTEPSLTLAEIAAAESFQEPGYDPDPERGHDDPD